MDSGSFHEVNGPVHKRKLKHSTALQSQLKELAKKRKQKR